MKSKDQSVADGLKAGNRAAYQTAMNLYGPLVISIASTMVRDKRDIEEIVQDTFVNVFRSINRFNPQETMLSTWIGRIAFNRSVDLLRQRRPEELLDDSTAAYRDVPGENDSDDLSIEDDIGLLREAILSLRADERTLLTLVYFEKMPLTDAAYILKSNPAALSARLYRLRHKLSLIINEKRIR